MALAPFDVLAAILPALRASDLGRLDRLTLDTRGTGGGVAPPLTHPLIRGLCIAAVIVGLMTFVVMPRYTRLVQRWLYEDTE